MGVDAVIMMDSVVVMFSVCAGSFDQIDTDMEIHDFFGFVDFVEQGVFEVDEPDIEYESGSIQFDELFGCWFEGFGACAGRDEDIYLEVVVNDVLDDVFEGQDRDINAFHLLFLGLLGAGCESC